jgi:hypothetical protein
MATRGSFEWQIEQVRAAIARARPGEDLYVEETHSDTVVVRNWEENRFFRVPYEVGEDDQVTLGDFAEVEQAWSEVSKQIRLLVPVAKAEDPPRRLTYGVVLEPDTVDLQGDVMSAQDIELAAHAFMEESRAGGVMHEELVQGACVVESYLAPADFEVETADGAELVRKGSWVLAMHWPEDVWKRIAGGELTGYSVGGQGVRIPLEEDEA